MNRLHGTSQVATGLSDAEALGSAAGGRMSGGLERTGPAAGVRDLLDAMRDAIVATDPHGHIAYVNPAAEAMFGWPAGTLVGRSVLDLVPPAMAGSLLQGFEEFARGHLPALLGRALNAVIRRPDGSEVQTELVISLVDDGAGDQVILGLFRPREVGSFHRWSGLTNELLTILASASIDDVPDERLLATLGRQLGWDVTTLWALTPSRQLRCRSVWSRSEEVAPAFTREKKEDPRSGAEGLPSWVLAQNEPVWVPDMLLDDRFATDATAADGIRSAYAFPIRYRGACVGIVKMLSVTPRERDPAVVELMDAVGGQLGELLHASALAAERELLVQELQEVRRGHEFLLLATQVLSEAVTYQEMVDRLARVAVPVLADLCLIDIRDEDGQMRRMAAWHGDPSKQALADELRRTYSPDPSSMHPIMDVMRSGQSRWDAHMSDEFLRATSRDESHYAIIKALDFTSYMTVPLRLRNGDTLGTVTLVSAGSGRRFSEADLVFAEQLADQVSSVVQRARANEKERRTSHELQRNLLPDVLPDVEGWSVAARYLPGSDGVEVGGDWFDVVTLGPDSVALVVGDVEGHDLQAAKFMSRLRQALSLLITQTRDPAEALTALNEYIIGTSSDRMATALVGVLNVDSGLVRFSSAGHLSPFAIGRGQAQDLGVCPGPPLGVESTYYGVSEFDASDSNLLLFTDGLVERRDQHIDQGLRRLMRASASSPAQDPDVLVDHVVGAMTSDEGVFDDIVVLSIARAVESSEFEAG